MPAIWTDDDGKVKRIHNFPDRLPDEQLSDAYMVDSVPEPASTKTGERAVLYYDSSTGFSHEYVDETTTFPDSIPEKHRRDLYEAVSEGEVERAADILGRFL